MKPAARIQAAAEIIDDVLHRHRAASVALADWGKSHRFAGSGDRSVIGTLVYDALRRKQSIAWRFNADSGRALALGAASAALGLNADELAVLCDGSAYGPAPLTDAEHAALSRSLDGAPPHIAGDYPDWLAPSLAETFGARAAAEGAAMAERAPVDLRVNTLRADRDKVLKELAAMGAVATLLSPLGVRIPPPIGSKRQPNVEAEAAHGKGWYEVQDEGSQIAAAMTGAGKGQQVLDLCAGAGGKTLAMAAAMNNTGQIYAYDDDKLRLRPIFERLTRADARSVQVISAGDTVALADLGPRLDCVLVDAPCTGAGTWRRKPDAKWRLKPETIAERQRQQQTVLALGARHVRPGGRLVYVTCSLLAAENGGQVAGFLAAHAGFAVQPWREVWRAHLKSPPPAASADGRDDTLLLTPASHGTDGFFIAVMRRAR